MLMIAMQGYRLTPKGLEIGEMLLGFLSMIQKIKKEVGISRYRFNNNNKN